MQRGQNVSAPHGVKATPRSALRPKTIEPPRNDRRRVPCTEPSAHPRREGRRGRCNARSPTNAKELWCLLLQDPASFGRDEEVPGFHSPSCGGGPVSWSNRVGAIFMTKGVTFPSSLTCRTWRSEWFHFPRRGGGAPKEIFSPNRPIGLRSPVVTSP